MTTKLTGIVSALLLTGLVTAPVHAGTLQLDFDISFGDPLDPDTAAPDGPAPWLTAVFDDGGSAGTVALTFSVSGGINLAEITQIYLNIDPVFDPTSLTFTRTGGTGPAAGDIALSRGTDSFKADADGWYDILFDLPNAGGDSFDAGETLSFDIAGTGILASSFGFLSTPDPVDPNGPFLGAAKFQSTGNGDQSDWVGAVPVPAAVWLFGSGLLGLVGIARRKA